MSRYIDADELKKVLDDGYTKHFLSSAELVYVDQMIDNAPTADVQPVVKGEWIDIWEDNSYNKFCKCSVCDRWSIKQYASDMNYCPNCGARMVEE